MIKICKIYKKYQTNKKIKNCFLKKINFSQRIYLKNYNKSKIIINNYIISLNNKILQYIKKLKLNIIKIKK